MLKCPHCLIELLQYRNFSICMSCGFQVLKPVKIRKLNLADYQKMVGENN